MLKMGNVLKHARLQKGMTLEDLSLQCGYSKALISRIENDSVSPSILSLTKISEALDLTLYDIFANVEVDEPTILRMRDRQKFSALNGQHELEFLTTGATGKLMQPLLITLEGDADSWAGTDLRNGEEFFLVLEGRAEVFVGERRYVLKAGDSIYLKSTIAHTYRGMGKSKTVSLAVTYPPYY
ncbi:MAG: XRE family transcriptional regulator [Candidatus Abyssobacteria bacterium SURF_17]|uniref:XRE family transcriptional regulator n=1 Tax=Candidatus Abyssobacteria bacterium SURF_17 TaxID=2093361 RepID=A0A419F965_9BACT|nr:MAG: XRE family transcriptional regulator [Candidatus Abyssubacteria bacterium SURF_17]